MPIDQKRLEYQLSKNMLSGKDLAEKTGLSKMTISGIRSGKVKNPKPSTMRKLCEALHCEPADLIEDPDKG